MMRKTVVVLCVAGHVMLAGCLFTNSKSVEILSIGDNDMSYRFGEVVNMNVTLKSSKSIDNITIILLGLKNKVGKEQLYETLETNLSSGTHNVTFLYKIPSCSPCNKLDPGTYALNVTVLHDDETLAHKTTEVKLVV